jgi:hypothetical protein
MSEEKQKKSKKPYKKNLLNEGVEKAMSLPTEKERLYAVIDLIRGYKNEYHPVQEKDKNEGFERCKTDLVIIRDKIKAKLDDIFDNISVSSETKEHKHEKRYFIYVYRQQGNIGSFEFLVIEDQPKEGFVTEEKAEEHLLFLINEGKAHWFDRKWYKYVVMKTFVMKK